MPAKWTSVSAAESARTVVEITDGLSELIEGYDFPVNKSKIAKAISLNDDLKMHLENLKGNVKY